MAHHNDIATILNMFSYARPMGSQTEKDFIAQYLTPLGFKPDAFGNQILELHKPDGTWSKTLFSSHSDTVDRGEGRKGLALWPDEGLLGAEMLSLSATDKTAGVWLMTEMVKAKIPGLYIIHYGEENGCLGSQALAEKTPNQLRHIEHAIAFDRAGTSDVVTYQMGRRTCSDAFALALCNQLGGEFKPSPDGVYTDTNEYAGLVPECTNISVGYSRQHSQDEQQNVDFLIELRDTLLTVDWAALPTERAPQKEDVLDWALMANWPEVDEYESAVEENPAIAVALLKSCGISLADFYDEAGWDTGRVADER
jgi:hypothetical protein